jgi:hypothetical protein
MPFEQYRNTQISIGPLRLDVVEGNMPPDEIRLWQGNPRIKHLLTGFNQAPADEDLRALVEEVQRSAYAKLKNDILKFEQQEPVFVRPVQPGAGPVENAVVLEGNSRVAILKDLHERHPKDDKFARVKVYLLPFEFPETSVVILMSNYHIKGTLRNQWDRYQIGAYVYEQVKIKRLFSQVEMAEIIAVSQSWISRLLQVFELAMEFRDDLEADKELNEKLAEKETNEKFSLLEEAWKVKAFRDQMDSEPVAKKTLFRWVHDDKFADHRSIRAIYEIYRDADTRNAVESGGPGAGDRAASKVVVRAPVNEELDRFARWIESIPFGALKDVDAGKVQRAIEALKGLESAATRMGSSS